jgi:hypothetical protein
MEGEEELVARIKSGEQPKELADIRHMFNKAYFKNLATERSYLSGKAVQPGDVWPFQDERPSGTSRRVVSEFKVNFRNWERHGKRNCARLEYQGTMKSLPRPDAEPGATGPRMMMADTGNTASGVSWFDPELGMTLEAVTRNERTLVQCGTPIPSASEPPVSPPTQCHQTITLKLISVQ